MTTLFDDLRSELAAGMIQLPDKPEESVDSSLRALWQTATGHPMSVERAALAPLPQLDSQGIARLRELIAQRLAGIPLGHLTGRQHFMGLEMLCGPEALIPRRETELLGRGALESLKSLTADGGAVRVVDVCTGSGNLALALATHVPSAHVYAADLSMDAIDLAQRNADFLGLAARVEFRSGDLLAPFDEPVFLGHVDLLVCNPPYISSKKVDTMHEEIIGHEPRLAFDGGPLGIRIVERLIREAPRFLRPGGVLAFEVGLGQGPAIVKRMAKIPAYGDLRTIQDELGEVRAIVAHMAARTAS